MSDDVEQLKSRLDKVEGRLADLESLISKGQPHRVDVAVFNNSRNPAKSTVTQTQYAFTDREKSANPATEPATQTQYAFSDRTTDKDR